MQLVESYLVEISRFLPDSQREDILVELRSTLEEQILETASSSEPTLEDQKTVLNRFGHPLKVASEYQEQRYLIGPELFPTFVQTIKTVLSILIPLIIAVYALSWVSFDSNSSIRSLLSTMLSMAMWSTLIIFVVFVVLEYSGEHLNLYDKWSADSLSATNHATIKRSDLVTNIFTESVFLLWWNDVLTLQNWLPGFGEDYSISLTESWSTLFWPLNILAGAWLAIHIFVLLRGFWSRTNLQAEIILGIAGLAVCAWLLVNQPLVEISGDVGSNGQLILNRSTITVLLAIGGVIVWDIYLAIKRLRRGRV